MLSTVLTMVVLTSIAIFVGGLVMVAAAVLPTFRSAPANVYIWMHQTLDRYIERYMPPTAGFTVLHGIGLFFLLPGTRARLLVAAGVVFTATVSAISQFGNVPINKRVKTWHPEEPPPPGEITRLLARWRRLHLARTTSAVLALLAFISAAVIR
ncbi:MAG: anthrone oxygenase family protein [Archangium sp.]